MEAQSWRAAREQLLAELQADADGRPSGNSGATGTQAGRFQAEPGPRLPQTSGDGYLQRPPTSPVRAPHRPPATSPPLGTGVGATAGATARDLNTTTRSVKVPRGVPTNVAVAQQQLEQLLRELPPSDFAAAGAAFNATGGVAGAGAGGGGGYRSGAAVSGNGSSDGTALQHQQQQQQRAQRRTGNGYLLSKQQSLQRDQQGQQQQQQQQGGGGGGKAALGRTIGGQLPEGRLDGRTKPTIAGDVQIVATRPRVRAITTGGEAPIGLLAVSSGGLTSPVRPMRGSGAGVLPAEASRAAAVGAGGAAAAGLGGGGGGVVTVSGTAAATGGGGGRRENDEDDDDDDDLQPLARVGAVVAAAGQKQLSGAGGARTHRSSNAGGEGGGGGVSSTGTVPAETPRGGGGAGGGASSPDLMLRTTRRNPVFLDSTTSLAPGVSPTATAGGGAGSGGGSTRRQRPRSGQRAADAAAALEAAAATAGKSKIAQQSRPRGDAATAAAAGAGSHHRSSAGQVEDVIGGGSTSPVPLTTAVLKRHTSGLHGEEVWEETAAAAVEAAAAAAAAAQQPPVMTRMSSLPRSKFVVGGDGDGDGDGSKRDGSAVRQLKADAVRGLAAEVSGLSGAVAAAAATGRGLPVAVSAAAIGARNNLAERIRSVSDAAGAVAVRGERISSAGAGGAGGWTKSPLPIGSVRTSETGDGVRIVANRRASARRHSQLSEAAGGGLSSSIILANETSSFVTLTVSAVPSTALGDASTVAAGSPPLLERQLLQLRQQYGHMYPPSSPPKGQRAPAAGAAAAAAPSQPLPPLPPAAPPVAATRMEFVTTTPVPAAPSALAATRRNFVMTAPSSPPPPPSHHPLPQLPGAMEEPVDQMQPPQRPATATVLPAAPPPASSCLPAASTDFPAAAGRPETMTAGGSWFHSRMLSSSSLSSLFTIGDHEALAPGVAFAAAVQPPAAAAGNNYRKQKDEGGDSGDGAGALIDELPYKHFSIDLPPSAAGLVASPSPSHPPDSAQRENADTGAAATAAAAAAGIPPHDGNDVLRQYGAPRGNAQGTDNTEAPAGSTALKDDENTHPSDVQGDGGTASAAGNNTSTKPVYARVGSGASVVEDEDKEKGYRGGAANPTADAIVTTVPSSVDAEDRPSVPLPSPLLTLPPTVLILHAPEGGMTSARHDDITTASAAAAALLARGQESEIDPQGRRDQGAADGVMEMKVEVAEAVDPTVRAAVMAAPPASPPVPLRAAGTRRATFVGVPPSTDGSVAEGQTERREYVPTSHRRHGHGSGGGGGGARNGGDVDGYVDPDAAAAAAAAHRRGASARRRIASARPTTAASRRHGAGSGGGGGTKDITNAKRRATLHGITADDADGDDADGALRSLRANSGREWSTTSRAGRPPRGDDGGGDGGTVAQLSRTAAVVGSSVGGRKVVMDVMVVRPQTRRSHHSSQHSGSFTDGGSGYWEGGGAEGGGRGGSDESDLEALRRGAHGRGGMPGAAARSRPVTAKSRPTTAKAARPTTAYHPSSRPTTARPTTAHQRPTTARPTTARARPTTAAQPRTHGSTHAHHHHHRQQPTQPSQRNRPDSAKSTYSTRFPRQPTDSASSGSETHLSEISDLSAASTASHLQLQQQQQQTARRRRPTRSAPPVRQARFHSDDGGGTAGGGGAAAAMVLRRSNTTRKSNSFERMQNGGGGGGTNARIRFAADEPTPAATAAAASVTRRRRSAETADNGGSTARPAASDATEAGTDAADLDTDTAGDGDDDGDDSYIDTAAAKTGHRGLTDPSDVTALKGGAAGPGGPRGPTMAMVREAHLQLQRQKAMADGPDGQLNGEDGEDGEEGGAHLRRKDAGADSYMLRIFGSAYTKVAGSGEEGDGGTLKVWLHPYCNMRMRLDMLWVATALLLAAIVPLQVAFTTPETMLPYLLANLVCSVVWCAHVVFNFMTGYDEDGEIVMDAVQVRNRYCRTYLVLDVTGALPYALIAVLWCGGVGAGLPPEEEFDGVGVHGIGGGGGDGDRGHCSVRGGLMLRLWALLGLVSLPRLFHYLSKWQDTWDVDIHMMRLVKLLGLALIFTHLFACMSYYVQLIEGFPQDGWVVVGGLDGKGAWITYNFALLRALQVVMGSNVDTVSSSGGVEVVFTICSYIVGVVFYTILVGIMSSIVLSLNRSGQMYVEKLQIWRDYCHYRRLPGELRRRVMAYINTTHSNKRVLDDTTMLMELSPGLRTDINLQLCAELVATVPVFLECSPIVVRAMVAKLQRETHVAGDFVFRVGDIADAVYFILKGSVSISDETGSLLTRLAQGSHFGEFGILAYLDGQLGVRTAAARADDCVELYKLHCEDFASLADYYPELVDFFRDVAVVRSAYNATLRANRAMTELSESESGEPYDSDYDNGYDDGYGDNEYDDGYGDGDDLRSGDSLRESFLSSSGDDEDYEDLMRSDVVIGGSDPLLPPVVNVGGAAAAVTTSTTAAAAAGGGGVMKAPSALKARFSTAPVASGAALGRRRYDSGDSDSGGDDDSKPRRLGEGGVAREAEGGAEAEAKGVKRRPGSAGKWPGVGGADGARRGSGVGKDGGSGGGGGGGDWALDKKLGSLFKKTASKALSLTAKKELGTGGSGGLGNSSRSSSTTEHVPQASNASVTGARRSVKFVIADGTASVQTSSPSGGLTGIRGASFTAGSFNIAEAVLPATATATISSSAPQAPSGTEANAEVAAAAAAGAAGGGGSSVLPSSGRPSSGGPAATTAAAAAATLVGPAMAVVANPAAVRSNSSGSGGGGTGSGSGAAGGGGRGAHATVLIPETPPGPADAAAVTTTTPAAAAAPSGGSGPLSVLSAAGMFLSAALHVGGGGGNNRNLRNRILPQDSFLPHTSELQSTPALSVTAAATAGGSDGESDPSTPNRPLVAAAAAAAAAASGGSSLSLRKMRLHANGGSVANGPPGGMITSPSSAGGGGGGGGQAPGRGTSRLRNISIIAPEEGTSGEYGEGTDSPSVGVGGNGGGGGGVLGGADGGGGLNNAAAAAELASSVPMLARMRKMTDVMSFLNAVSRSGGGGGAAGSIVPRAGSIIMAASNGGGAAAAVQPALTRAGSILVMGGGGGGGGTAGPSALTRAGSILAGGGGVVPPAAALARAGSIILAGGGGSGVVPPPPVLTRTGSILGGGARASSTLDLPVPSDDPLTSSRGRTLSHMHSNHSNDGRATAPAAIGFASVAAAAAAAATTASATPSRSLSSGVTSLLRRFVNSRSSKDTRDAGGSASGEDVSVRGGRTAGGNGSISARWEGGGGGGHQPLRRKSVTMGATRSNASFFAPGTAAMPFRPGMQQQPLHDLEAGGGGGSGGGGAPTPFLAAAAAAAAAVAGNSNPNTNTNQFTAAAMRLASISTGGTLPGTGGLAGRLASITGGGAVGGTASMRSVSGAPGHHHGHHGHHHNRPSGGGTTSARDLLAGSAVYHGQHPLGPGVVNLGFG